MARRQTLRSGVGDKLVSVTQTTAKVSIPNYGASHLSTAGSNPTISISSGSTAYGFVLDAPVEGVHKYITVNLTTQSTAHTVTVQMATTNNVKLGHDTTGMVWQLSSAAEVHAGVHLVGISSTEWGVVSSYLTTFTT